MDSKENKPRRSTAGKTRSPPLSHLCGPVCGFCREGKVTALRSHTNPCLGRFCGAFGRAEFFRAGVGQPGKGDQNPIHKSAEFEEFYGLSQGAVLPED